MQYLSFSRSLHWTLALGFGLLAGACGSTPLASSSGTDAAPLESATAVSEPVAPAPGPERDFPWPYELIEGEPIFKLMEHDDLPSIDEPVFVQAELADAFMDLEEIVLGVVGKDGTAKCYSAWQLDSHEIVNDELDGQPIAATW